MSTRTSIATMVAAPLLLLAVSIAAPVAAQDADYGNARPRAPRARTTTVTSTHTPATVPAVGVRPLRPPSHSKALDPAPGHLTAAGPVPSVVDPGPFALVGGTVHTVSGATLERGAILIQNGEIAAVGTSVSVPDGVKQIDVTGYHVYPSLISADTVMGLAEIGAARATVDVSEVGEINPNVAAAVGVNPASELIPVTRSNGILVVMTAPRGGLISGTAAVIEMDGWTTEDMTLQAPVALLVNWPSMRLDHDPDATTPLAKQKTSRDDQITLLRETFETARAYARGRDAGRAGAAAPLDHDVKWDAMVKAVRGELPVLIHAPTVLELKAALDFADQQKLDVIIKSGSDLLRVKDRLKAKGIPVMVTSVLEIGRAWDPYDVNFTLPLELHEAGIKFCLVSGDNSFAAAHLRNLPYEAAKAVAYGLPAEIALKAITLYPAEILGVGLRLGSIERGKDATLIVTDGDPLDIRSNVHRAFIRGRELDLTDRHKRLYERYRTRPHDRSVR